MKLTNELRFPSYQQTADFQSQVTQWCTNMTSIIDTICDLPLTLHERRRSLLRWMSTDRTPILFVVLLGPLVSIDDKFKTRYYNEVMTWALTQAVDRLGYDLTAGIYPLGATLGHRLIRMECQRLSSSRFYVPLHKLPIASLLCQWHLPFNIASSAHKPPITRHILDELTEFGANPIAGWLCSIGLMSPFP
jgi:hypothetical protein